MLLVKKVSGESKASIKIPLQEIKPSPDRHLSYVKDYVGRNLRACGYISMGGELRCYYGHANVKLVPVATDGSFVDVSDPEALQQYYVTAQNVAPNSEIHFEFETNSAGEEYNFTSSVSIPEIELTVERLS